MVDEAQDLNETQVRLLRLLTGGNGSGPQRFLVGDAKQSIYRFRGSTSIATRRRSAAPAARSAP